MIKFTLVETGKAIGRPSTARRLSPGPAGNFSKFQKLATAVAITTAMPSPDPRRGYFYSPLGLLDFGVIERCSKWRVNMYLSTTIANFTSNSQTPLKPLAPTPPLGCMMMISIWIRMGMILHPKEGVSVEEREVPDVKGLLHLRGCLNASMTRSHGVTGSSHFDEAHFYQYLDDHFSRLNLRLDVIDER
ncbi:hypothetical protein Cgig2_033759 [Carnegiea gigantea]|uniref:Uncharacterized protein n=1 Tax=Carnegiea gigantea TaxID=171969 RepID=A0A9Q1QKB4_9CARY|nr:hypothetical protein Cgig2_033759 [Carnegiea gigantea]